MYTSVLGIDKNERREKYEDINKRQVCTTADA